MSSFAGDMKVERNFWLLKLTFQTCCVLVILVLVTSATEHGAPNSEEGEPKEDLQKTDSKNESSSTYNRTIYFVDPTPPCTTMVLRSELKVSLIIVFANLLKSLNCTLRRVKELLLKSKLHPDYSKIADENQNNDLMSVNVQYFFLINEAK